MPEDQKQIKSADKQIKSDTKKISVILDMNLIRKISDNHLTQSEAVVKGLEILFSDDYQNIKSHKQQIIEDEKHIAIYEARLSEFDMIKGELERVHGLLDDQKELDRAHMTQVQTLINEVRSNADNIRQKEEKILLLENASKKRKWWKLW